MVIMVILNAYNLVLPPSISFNSLRCQSLISLKLYKLRRANCRAIIANISEFFRVGRGDIVNGNTPSSISPSNSVGSQVSPPSN